jgi:cob(II)yrinic acid a,c-diamide reductase
LLKMNEVGPQHYRDAMARFGGAVHVVTTDGPAGRRGTTIIATCSVSDSPPTVLVCLNRENRSNDLFVENGRFALNTLPHEMQPLAEAFSGLTGLTQDERFALGEWEVLATGAPVLKGALAAFDCEIIETVDHATHRVLFGKVTALKVGDRLRPLVYFDRAYRAL